MNNFILYGVIFAVLIVILYFIFFKKTSFYDTNMFPDTMTEEEAVKKVEEETQRISNEYTEKLNKVFTEEEKNTIAKEMENEVSKISEQYNQFMMKKSSSS